MDILSVEIITFNGVQCYKPLNFKKSEKNYGLLQAEAQYASLNWQPFLEIIVTLSACIHRCDHKEDHLFELHLTSVPATY